MKRQHPDQPSAPHKRRRHDASAVDVVLAGGKKRLFRALKAARGFERQKLGRRTKQAHAKQAAGDVARIEAEVAALKVGPRVAAPLPPRLC